MAAETIGFAVRTEDRPELDRLVDHFGGGNRSQFLREALRVMSIQERAERLRLLQAQAQEETGKIWSADEVTALTRSIIKGQDG